MWQVEAMAAREIVGWAAWFEHKAREKDPDRAAPRNKDAFWAKLKSRLTLASGE